MKFIVSSSELLSSLQSVSKVISNKPLISILENILFDLDEAGKTLTLTASDQETILSVNMTIENIEEGGKTTMPAKLLIDTLKEFPDQPLGIIVDPNTNMAEISWETGKASIPCSAADEYPQMRPLKDDHSTLTIEAEQLLEGITKTLFAVADDELRPAMNGIFFDMKSDGLTFVASDAHKLVRFRQLNIIPENENSFILPKKPANFLKGILMKSEDTVTLKFDTHYAIFTSPRFNMACRLIEGNFPAYNSVIPAGNPKKVEIDRVECLTALRRVAVFSNQASNLIKLKIAGNEINVSAQDLDFSISANERVRCRYENEDLEIGFKSTFLIEILSNISSPEVRIELADSARAGLFIPVETEEEERRNDLLMLLMPIVIGD
ncbi:MAG: DNA polymerase III subunit beta [Prevotellaceae bacterium]|jgi:DNA polymerase-3 subunit beta|nr:DNA polymerase III subunit beta [Prevotellaceae bacterium]